MSRSSVQFDNFTHIFFNLFLGGALCPRVRVESPLVNQEGVGGSDPGSSVISLRKKFAS